MAPPQSGIFLKQVPLHRGCASTVFTLKRLGIFMSVLTLFLMLILNTVRSVNRAKRINILFNLLSYILNELGAKGWAIKQNLYSKTNWDYLINDGLIKT